MSVYLLFSAEYLSRRSPGLGAPNKAKLQQAPRYVGISLRQHMNFPIKRWKGVAQASRLRSPLPSRQRQSSTGQSNKSHS